MSMKDQIVQNLHLRACLYPIMYARHKSFNVIGTILEFSHNFLVYRTVQY